MTIKLDHDLLVRLGLGELDAADGAEVLSLLHEVLQTRVGIRIADRLSEAELAEFEAAMETGDAEASRWLDVNVPDHVEIVRDEFDDLCAQVAEAAPVMLAELSRRSEPDDRDATPAGPEPGPTLVGSEDDPCLVVSPSAGTVVGVNAGRDELWARRSDLPPVVLRLPVDHRVDVSTLWCGDGGEVRSGSEEFDLRWQVPDRSGSPVVDSEECAPLPRPPLAWTDVRGRGFVEFTEGPWHVEDGQFIEMTNSETGRRLWLEQLHDGPHTNAVRPHFTPDARQLVAVYNAKDEPVASGLAACSVDRLNTTPVDDDGEAVRVPWEHVVQPNAEAEPGDGPPEVLREGLLLDDLGYDPSVTRAAVTDGVAVHVLRTSDWSSVGVIRRPDRAALTVRVPIPGGEAPLVCWAGHSVVAAASDGTVWRLDPRASIDPEQIARFERPPVAAVGLGDRVVLVHADRRLVTVDDTGAVSVQELAGAGQLNAADAIADGRLLVATRTGLELWAGTVLHAQAGVPGAAIAGVAACARMSEWSLLWFADGSIASARSTGRRIRVDRGRLPHQRIEGFTPTASTALMVDVDEWFLAQERTSDEDHPRTVVAATVGWVDVAARCLAYMPSAGLVAAGTETGLDFISTMDTRLSRPRRIELGSPVGAVAAGLCPRSLAVGTPGAMWMVRLLA